jgi:hypothetical protein
MADLSNFDPSLPLEKPQMEKFAQILTANPNINLGRAAYMCQYGFDKGHKTLDYYHNQMGKRLYGNEKIQLRIKYLREKAQKDDSTFVKSCIDMLKDIVNGDITQYMNSVTVTRDDGSKKTSYYQTKDLQQIPIFWRKTFIDSIDPKTGNPIYMKRSWALEKLLSIYGIVNGNQNGADVIDRLAELFEQAGLSYYQENYEGVSAEELDAEIEGIEDSYNMEITPPQASTMDSNEEGE